MTAFDRIWKGFGEEWYQIEEQVGKRWREDKVRANNALAALAEYMRVDEETIKKAMRATPSVPRPWRHVFPGVHIDVPDGVELFIKGGDWESDWAGFTAGGRKDRKWTGPKVRFSANLESRVEMFGVNL